jgi:hypothetical protein
MEGGTILGSAEIWVSQCVSLTAPKHGTMPSAADIITGADPHPVVIAAPFVFALCAVLSSFWYRSPSVR